MAEMEVEEDILFSEETRTIGPFYTSNMQSTYLQETEETEAAQEVLAKMARIKS